MTHVFKSTSYCLVADIHITVYFHCLILWELLTQSKRSTMNPTLMKCLPEVKRAIESTYQKWNGLFDNGTFTPISQEKIVRRELGLLEGMTDGTTHHTHQTTEENMTEGLTEYPTGLHQIPSALDSVHLCRLRQ